MLSSEGASAKFGIFILKYGNVCLTQRILSDLSRTQSIDLQCKSVDFFGTSGTFIAKMGYQIFLIFKTKNLPKRCQVSEKQIVS